MLPTLFISHGSPMMPLRDQSARDFLRGLGGLLERPKAILVASAHWDTERPEITAVSVNTTIHDFFGFPPALYELVYPAPGDAALAGEIAAILPPKACRPTPISPVASITAPGCRCC